MHEKEASTQEVRGYSRQFAEAHHVEYNSWFDNEVFLTLLTQGRSSQQITRQEDGCSASRQKKHFNFLQAKARWVLSGFQDEQK